jgi:hypothetical protein
MSIATRRNSGTLAERGMSAAGTARRQLLQRAAILLGVVTTSRALAAPCVAPDEASSGLRKSLNYTESSPNPAQRCSGCSFFSDAQGDCGKCMIFGGPTSINGHCDSWAARS